MASLAVAALAFGWSTTRAPVYEARVEVSVTSGRAISGESVTQQDTVFIGRNYAELAMTEPVVAEAVARSGLPIPVSEARSRLHVRAASDVGFLRVTAQGPDPAEAEVLAAAVADALLDAVAASQRDALSQALAPIEAEIVDVEQRLLQIGPDMAERATIEARFDALVRAATERRLAPTDRLVVVAPSRSDPSPVSPTPLRDAAVALVAALVVNAELAVLFEALKDRFPSDDPDEAIRNATDLPVLSRVPSSGGAEVVEAFRTLRTNLMFMDASQSLRTVAVVSAEPNAGKSFTALHLAASMAGLETPVVLVEGDLRRPGLHEELEVPLRAGLGDLAGGVEPGQIVHRVPGSGHLHLVPGGQPLADPTAVLGTYQFGNVLSSLEWAAIVVVDTPACALFADGLAIASQCDATIVVVDPRRSRRRAIERVVRELRHVGANPIGVVLNRIEATDRSSYYYYGANQRPLTGVGQRGFGSR